MWVCVHWTVYVQLSTERAVHPDLHLSTFTVCTPLLRCHSQVPSLRRQLEFLYIPSPAALNSMTTIKTQKACMWQLLCILPFFSIITMTQKYRKGWHINKRIKTSLDSLHSFHRRRHTHYQPHQHSTESVAVHYIVMHWNALQYITFPNVKSHYIKFTYVTHQRGNPINIPLSPLLFYLISRGDLKYALQNTNSHQTMTIVLNDFNVDCCHSKH